jgi:hypothetical protein
MITIEKEGNCTIFKVMGEVTAYDIIMKAVEYIQGDQTKTSLWDFTQTSKVKVTSLEIKAIAEGLKGMTKDGKIRKAALVGSKVINIGLGKMFIAFAQMAGLPYTYKVFRNMEDAQNWLKDD